MKVERPNRRQLPRELGRKIGPYPSVPLWFKLYEFGYRRDSILNDAKVIYG